MLTPYIGPYRDLRDGHSKREAVSIFEILTQGRGCCSIKFSKIKKEVLFAICSGKGQVFIESNFQPFSLLKKSEFVSINPCMAPIVQFKSQLKTGSG